MFIRVGSLVYSAEVLEFLGILTTKFYLTTVWGLGELITQFYDVSLPVIDLSF